MKKTFLILFLIVFSGCTPKDQKPTFSAAAIKENDQQTHIAAVLLPLSGTHAKIGEILKNTAMLAKMDVNNENLVLKFYDTKGSTEGARDAADRALADKAEVVIGPLFSYETEAVKSRTLRKNVNVLTLSSDPSVLQKGVYTVSLLLPQQVDRIVTYACEKGKKNFAVLATDNTSGEMMIEAARASAERCGGRLSKVGYYNVRKGTYDQAVKTIIGTEYTQWINDNRKQKRGEKKEIQYDEEGNIIPEPEPEVPELDFDAVLIAEEGNKLRSIGALLRFYDLPAQLLGTSLWANDTTIQKENALIGGIYAAPPSRGFLLFQQKYRGIFEESPPRIAGQMYDAIKIASILSEHNNFSEAAITDPYGFIGIDGPFRLLSNGYSERGLEVKQVKRRTLPTLSEIEPFNDQDPYYLNKSSGKEIIPEKKKPTHEDSLYFDDNGNPVYSPIQYDLDGNLLRTPPLVDAEGHPVSQEKSEIRIQPYPYPVVEVPSRDPATRPADPALRPKDPAVQSNVIDFNALLAD